MKLTAFFDGGGNSARGVDRPGAGAAVLYDGDKLIAQRAKYLYGKTVNEAEYTGLLLAMELALEHGATELQIYGDSEVVVSQVNGVYEARKDHLRVLRDQAWVLGQRFQKVRIELAPRGPKGKHRDNNALADALATKCKKAGRDL